MKQLIACCDARIATLADGNYKEKLIEKMSGFCPYLY